MANVVQQLLGTQWRQVVEQRHYKNQVFVFGRTGWRSWEELTSEDRGIVVNVQVLSPQSSLDGGVPMIFDGVVSASGEQSCDESPLIPISEWNRKYS